MAFRLHEALGTQNERYFVAATPPATRLRAYASTTPLPRPPPGSLPVWVGSPLTGRVSHPLDDKQSFMMSSHHHSPLTSLAWSHRAPARVPGKLGQGGQDAVM